MYWKNDMTADNQAVNEDASLGFEEPFDEGYEEEEGEPLDTESLVEAFMIDEIGRMSDEQRKAYIESTEFHNLCEAGVISEAGMKNIFRLNRESDLNRRVSVAAIEKARANGDVLYNQLEKAMKMRHAALDKIYTKYARQVKKSAMDAQKKMLKINPQIFNTLRAIR
jgi:hypothetical protein